MVMNAAIQFVHEQLTGKKKHPKFKAGDNVTVTIKLLKAEKNVFKALKVMY